ncbi:MAG: DUF192 domain-containing protein [Candidatus Woesearchaeota archaeon]
MATTRPFRSLRFRTPAPCTLTHDRTGKPLAESLMAANNPLQQGLGLIGRRLPPKTGLVFPLPRKRRFRLHMWFVPEAIDVVFCDHTSKGLVIKDVKRGFRPFKNYKARQEAELFIELPRGAAKGVRTGDTLSLPRKIFKQQSRSRKV